MPDIYGETKTVKTDPSATADHPFGFEFSVDGTPELSVMSRAKLTTTANLPEDLRGPLLAYWSPILGADTRIDDVLEICDGGALTHWTCRVTADQSVVHVVGGHFGDTLVCVLSVDGALVATIEDGEIRGV